jgi:hypothetical protein
VKYRDILGYSKNQPKKVVKEEPKPTVTDILKEQFGDTVNEGPAYEYASYLKNIEKTENLQAKAVNKLVKVLQKKGFKNEATNLASMYMSNMRKFNDYLEELTGKLM